MEISARNDGRSQAPLDFFDLRWNHVFECHPRFSSCMVTNIK